MTLHDQFRQWFYAHEIRVVILSQLAAALAGTLAGVWCSRTRMFGWVAIVLLMLSGAAAFADTFEPPNLTTGLIVSWTFYFVAPLGVIYSFYARRRAQDRAVALVAFAGAIVMAGFFGMSLVLTLFYLFGVRFRGTECFPI